MNIRESRHATAMVGILLLGACTAAETTSSDSTRNLPKPDVVIVQPFAVAPDEVKLDRGLSAEMQQAMRGASRSAQEQQAGQQVSEAIAQKIADHVRDLGLAAQVGTEARLRALTWSPMRTVPPASASSLPPTHS